MKLRRTQIILIFFSLAGLMLACNLPLPGYIAPSLAEAEATALARTAIGIPTALAQLTLQSATVPSLRATPEPKLTVTPQPTATPAPPSYESFEAYLADARVLIYEDVYSNMDLLPRLQPALDGLDLDAENIEHTQDAVGRFSNHLRDSNWDLVIVATENRPRFNLGVWDQVYQHTADGGALIVEAWYLDEVSIGQITPLLQQCGIRVHGEWYRYEPYEVYSYVVYGIQPASDFFTRPNTIELPIIPQIYWESEDAGDLIKLAADSPGSAQLLAGLYPTDAQGNGLIVSCEEGRILFQTFSSHDYPRQVMLSLWQNYIYNTLYNTYQTLD